MPFFSPSSSPVNEYFCKAVLSRLLIERTSIDDGLSIMVTAQHHQKVTDHGG